MSLFGMGIQTLSHKSTPLIIVSAQQDTWNLTLRITESSGKGYTVVIGGSPNASDNQDELDYPEPPAPPTPYVRAWLDTPFSIPYDNLLQEYKHTPSQHMEWNLSIIWVSETENNTPTTISITWDSTQLLTNNFKSFHLYENNTAVTNMLTHNSYSFESNGTLRRFQIIGQTTSTNGNTAKNDLPIFPILIGIGGIIIVVIIALFLYKQKK
jgi:hypothetical protein